MNEGNLAVIDDDSLLQQVATGAYLSTIAAQYGVTHQALSKRLNANPDYKIVREVAHEHRLTEREKELEEIDDAATQVALARARELLSHARWRAEREFPERWGQKGAAAPSLTVVVHRGDVQIGVSSEAHCAAPSVELPFIQTERYITP